jgi:hypothetical protein
LTHNSGIKDYVPLIARYASRQNNSKRKQRKKPKKKEKKKANLTGMRSGLVKVFG